ncbi:MAG: hypothetical protein HY906_00360 [Deltaproteobacteria bacterium]|nr:hypothetical protein [Deltaproteobacteria bacterium]
MPLPFRSLSHGTVAFGFFNIEIDMLLLEQLFFFADRFCSLVVDLHRCLGPDLSLPGWRIRDPAAVGNVNLAIRGVHLGGFIGETYREFPFPERPEGFKQKPDGHKNRVWAEAAIQRFGEPEELQVRVDPATGAIAVAEYVFDPATFGDLVDYVDRGGYPRWEREVRPAYVAAMMAALGRPSQTPSQ